MKKLVASVIRFGAGPAMAKGGSDPYGHETAPQARRRAVRAARDPQERCRRF